MQPWHFEAMLASSVIRRTALARTPLQSVRALSTAVVFKPQDAILSLAEPPMIRTPIPREHNLFLPEPKAPFDLLPEGAKEGQAIVVERLSELLFTKCHLMKIGTCFEDNFNKRRKSQDFNPEFFDEFVVLLDRLQCDSLAAHLEGHGIDFGLLNGFGVNQRTEWGLRNGENSYARESEFGYSSVRPGLIYAAITTYHLGTLAEFHQNYESPHTRKKRLQQEKRLEELRQQAVQQ